jgi:serine/threonine-protein kinase
VLDDLEPQRNPRVVGDLPLQRRTQKGKSQAERLVDLSMGGLTLVTSERLLPETHVELILEGGLELAGTVTTTRSSLEQPDTVASIRFDALEPITETKLRDLLVRMLSMQDGKRAGRRLQLTGEAYWQAGAQAHHLELINLGRSGALLKGATTPPNDASGLLVVRRDDADMISIPAQVVWSRAGDPLSEIGVKFLATAEAAEQVNRMLEAVVSAPLPPKSAEPLSLEHSFRVGPLIGQGASSRVFRAEALRGVRAGKGVALWQVDQELADLADWTRRFWATLELHRTFNDPGVVPAYEAICTAERSWLVMEPMLGMSLDRVITMFGRTKQRLPAPAVLSVGIDVLETLGRCHEHQAGGTPHPIVHGDLRSSRILLTYDGDVKLEPFGGLAAWDGKKQLVSAETLPYLAPEVLQGGAPTEKSDLYQAGVVLYRALTGVHPYAGSSPEQLLRAVKHKPVEVESLGAAVPPAVRDIVLQLIAANPGSRPVNARATAQRLIASGVAPSAEAARLERLGLLDEARKAQNVADSLLVAEVTDAGQAAAAQPPPLPKKEGAAPAAAAAAAPQTQPLEAGQQIGRYTVLAELARGGMAQVWLARAAGPAGFAKQLVLKTILPPLVDSGPFVQMFLEEARLAAMINHPNVVQIFDLGFERGMPFIAMELIEGRTLSDINEAHHTAGKPFGVHLAARIIAEACAGLDFAHKLRDVSGKPMGLVHRDASARNILISYAGQVKLVDFGIAKSDQTRETARPGEVRGTLAYLSPEQLQSEAATAQSDVWALGVNLYAAVTGQTPFAAESEEEMWSKIINDNPAPMSKLRPDVDSRLDKLVATALAKKPSNRFASAGAMREELEQYLKSTRQVSTFDLSAMMEALFPAAKDSRRVQVNEMVTRSRFFRQQAAAAAAAAEGTAERRRKRRFALAGIGLAGAGVVSVLGWAVFHTRPAPVPVPAPPVVVAPQPPPPPEKPLPGKLSVDCNVPCTISVDSTLVGKGPVEIDPLTAGGYQVDAVATTPHGRGKKTQRVEVKAGEAAEWSAEFREGKLSLTSRPSGVEVTIDGVSYGKTPLKAKPVIEGEHDVVLIDRKKNVKVTKLAVVKPDGLTELKVDVKPGR